MAGILITVPAIARAKMVDLALSVSRRCVSHGLLDAMTDGGLGIAFFSPFSNTRYFLPWRPIMVGPINVLHAFSAWGGKIALSELKWVGGPCAATVLAILAIRKQTATRA